MSITPLSAEGFLERNPPTEPLSARLPFFAAEPDKHLWRCGLFLYPRYDALKAACERWKRGERCCECTP